MPTRVLRSLAASCRALFRTPVDLSDSTEIVEKMVPQLPVDVLNVLKQVHVNMPWKTLPQYLSMVLEFRINLELGFGSQELDRVPRSEFLSMARQLKERGCGITMHAPFWDLCTGSTDRLVRQVSRLRLQQFFDLVDVFDPVHVVCHTGFDPRHHGHDLSSWVARSLEVWEPLVLQAERQKTPLLLENVWEHGPELHMELFERIDSPCLGFCLDVGHQHSFSRTPILSWVGTLANFLMELHIHDNDGGGDAHLPVGQGTIDFVGLFQELNKGGRKPLLTLEPHREDHLVETLRGLKLVLNGQEGVN